MSLILSVGLVAAVEEHESFMFTDEILEDVERVLRQEHVGRGGRVFF